MDISQRLRGHVTEDAAARTLLDEAADDLDGYGELFGRFMLAQEESMAQFAKLREDQDALQAAHELYKQSVFILWNTPPSSLPLHRFSVLVECAEGVAIGRYYRGKWYIDGAYGLFESEVMRWAELSDVDGSAFDHRF